MSNHSASIEADSDVFMKTLISIERSRDPAALLKLFADDATLRTPAFNDDISGRDAIGKFWTAYLGLFDSIETTFTRVRSGGSFSALEWRSVGRLAGGNPIDYRGVTLLEFAGDLVRSFATYYDSAAFVPDFERHLHRRTP